MIRSKNPSNFLLLSQVVQLFYVFVFPACVFASTNSPTACVLPFMLQAYEKDASLFNFITGKFVTPSGSRAIPTLTASTLAGPVVIQVVTKDDVGMAGKAFGTTDEITHLVNIVEVHEKLKGANIDSGFVGFVTAEAFREGLLKKPSLFPPEFTADMDIAFVIISKELPLAWNFVSARSVPQFAKKMSPEVRDRLFNNLRTLVDQMNNQGIWSERPEFLITPEGDVKPTRLYTLTTIKVDQQKQRIDPQPIVDWLNSLMH